MSTDHRLHPNILRRIQEISDELHRTLIVRPEDVDRVQQEIDQHPERFAPLRLHVIGSPSLEPGEAYVTRGRPVR